MVKFDKGASLKLRAYVRTLFELIFHNTPIYAVDRQPLFCTLCARAQNVSKQSCHLGPSGPNGKIREKIPIICVFFPYRYIIPCCFNGFKIITRSDIMVVATTPEKTQPKISDLRDHSQAISRPILPWV